MAYYQPSYLQQSYSPYSASYQPAIQQPVTMPGTSYAPPQTSGPEWKWVDGEIGARAYQIPPGTPPGATIPLWDTNDMVIYLKSTNAMGMPNPLQKLRYYPETDKQQALPQGQSGDTATNEMPYEEAKYVTRDEFEKMKQEIEDILTAPKSKRGD